MVVLGGDAPIYVRAATPAQIESAVAWGQRRGLDIIIVGGGLYGCSVAYNLMKHGATDVVLLERGSICSGGTSKSCAIVRTHYSVLANMEHAVASLKIFQEFDEIVGGADAAGFDRISVRSPTFWRIKTYWRSVTSMAFSSCSFF